MPWGVATHDGARARTGCIVVRVAPHACHVRVSAPSPPLPSPPPAPWAPAHPALPCCSLAFVTHPPAMFGPVSSAICCCSTTSLATASSRRIQYGHMPAACIAAMHACTHAGGRCGLEEHRGHAPQPHTIRCRYMHWCLLALRVCALCVCIGVCLLCLLCVCGAFSCLRLLGGAAVGAGKPCQVPRHVAASHWVACHSYARGAHGSATSSASRAPRRWCQ